MSKMLLGLFVISYCLFVSGSPFHKYPYVFLLDIGNEELEKTNTEQLRLSTPGGSVALRYPAIGNGDMIGHVRVSGVDFGTDLKASVVDGGPGYNYVVLVFVGNPGVPYDAVVTIQTIAEETGTGNYNLNTAKELNGISEASNEVSESENNSAEDISNSPYGSETQAIERTHAEMVQNSNKAYKYAVNEVNVDFDENSKDIEDGNAKNHNIYNQSDNEEESDQSDESSDDEMNENDSKINDKNEQTAKDDENDNDSQEVNESSSNEESSEEDESNKKSDQSLFYINASNDQKDTGQSIDNPEAYYQNESDSNSDAGDETDEVYNDEEIHNDEEKVDSNTNDINHNIYSIDRSAVAS